MQGELRPRAGIRRAAGQAGGRGPLATGRPQLRAAAAPAAAEQPHQLDRTRHGRHQQHHGDSISFCQPTLPEEEEGGGRRRGGQVFLSPTFIQAAGGTCCRRPFMHGPQGARRHTRRAAPAQLRKHGPQFARRHARRAALAPARRVHWHTRTRKEEERG